MSSNFSWIQPLTVELAALEFLKNQHIILLALSEVPSFLIGSSLHSCRITIIARIQLDWTANNGVSCPLASGKIPIDLQLEKC